MDFANCN